MGVGQLWWQCYRRHQQNPWPCPDSVVSAMEGKKRESELWEDRAGSPLRDAVRSSGKKLIRLWNCLLPEPGPLAQLPKLIHLTACKKIKNTVSRWYWTVYIAWLAASYDTPKGKRWLNSNPPSHRGFSTIRGSYGAPHGHRSNHRGNSTNRKSEKSKWKLNAFYIFFSPKCVGYIINWLHLGSTNWMVY